MPRVWLLGERTAGHVGHIARQRLRRCNSPQRRFGTARGAPGSSARQLLKRADQPSGDLRVATVERKDGIGKKLVAARRRRG